MSLEVATCSQMQSDNQICKLLKNLAEKALNQSEQPSGKENLEETSQNENLKIADDTKTTLSCEDEKCNDINKDSFNSDDSSNDNASDVVSSDSILKKLVETNGPSHEVISDDDKDVVIIEDESSPTIQNKVYDDKITQHSSKSPKESDKYNEFEMVTSEAGTSITLNALANIKTSSKRISTANDKTKTPVIEVYNTYGDVQKSSKLLSDILSCDKITSSLPLRPVADLLIDIGMDCVKLQTYRDQIEFLETQPNNDEVKSNILKVKEAEKCLIERFKPYTVPCKACRCGYKCYFNVALTSHKRTGRSTSAGWFRCCYCSTFRTRSTTLFVDHLCDEHGVRGTTEPIIKHMCNYCPYENRDWRRTVMHEEKCKSRFLPSRNLSLPVTFLDMPIFGRPYPIVRNVPSTKSLLPSSSISYGHSMVTMKSPLLSSHQNMYNSLHQTSNRSVVQQRLSMYSSQSRVSCNTPFKGKTTKVSDIGNPSHLSMLQIQEVALAAVAQAQMQMGIIMKPQTSAQSANKMSVGASIQSSRVQLQNDARSKLTPTNARNSSPTMGPSCEICSAAVTSLEALLKHMQQVHQINIKSIDFFLRGKAFVCKTCFQGFWTQMGLTRHHQQMHSKPTYPCFICGPIISTDILTHLITKHNISLQDMLAFGWCYICKAEAKTPDRFTHHMVTVHPDLFPNRSILETMVVLFTGQKKIEITPRTNNQMIVASSKPMSSKSNKSSTITTNSQISFTRAKHRCNSCQVKFDNEMELEDHYQLLHTVTCTRCDERWTSVEAMLKHFNQKHYAEKDECIICQEQVKIGVPMIRHMKRMHLKKCSVVVKRLPPSMRMKYMQKLKRFINTSTPVNSFASIQPKVVIQNCDLKTDV